MKKNLWSVFMTVFSIITLSATPTEQRLEEAREAYYLLWRSRFRDAESMKAALDRSLSMFKAIADDPATPPALQAQAQYELAEKFLAYSTDHRTYTLFGNTLSAEALFQEVANNPEAAPEIREASRAQLENLRNLAL